ncbi:hypothetical protein Ngar_c09850 [Candidatus Nitrososphaera gargensis Ga9.2]|uniref:Uncharacterized protein n=1 Tax=Nitrososphaera gargensis (strain Ga9.2) TaxID=1237085 RepID=K0IIL5_NITGG|nr:hypothetical protein Ngar_c09850 [Candidatus Nitrososphaera gargensis Ga9.2]
MADDELKRKMRDFVGNNTRLCVYQLQTIIDGNNIKGVVVAGVPDFPWICGDELYQNLSREFLH